LARTTNFTLEHDRIVLLCPKGDKPNNALQFKAIEELWGNEGKPEVFENGDEKETAFLCYSSGTVS
jgi:hypothetical protein